MKYYIFASSSQGNCSMITDGTTNILIDAGISARRITDSLSRIGFSINDIHGVLITHEHSDHVIGLKTLCKNRILPIYTSKSIGQCLISATGNADLDLHFTDGSPFSIGSMTVTAFRTPHDSVESYGYKISSDSTFALATDMGMLTQSVVNTIVGSDAVLIEANHDIDMLKKGPYPYPLKKRVLSDFGHLCNSECGRLAAYLSKTGTKNIVLGHISQTNNTPELAYNTVKEYLGADNTSTNLCCAPVLGLLELEF